MKTGVNAPITVMQKHTFFFFFSEIICSLDIEQLFQWEEEFTFFDKWNDENLYLIGNCVGDLMNQK